MNNYRSTGLLLVIICEKNGQASLIRLAVQPTAAKSDDDHGGHGGTEFDIKGWL